jgi:hypothetical protein
MRIATLAALGLFALGMALPTGAYAQSCSQLRWACQNKGELGLEGAGTCRRYREECGRPQMGHCDKLRYACEHKDEMGLEGAGTCRRYREECGG